MKRYITREREREREKRDKTKDFQQANDCLYTDGRRPAREAHRPDERREQKKRKGCEKYVHEDVCGCKRVYVQVVFFRVS